MHVSSQAQNWFLELSICAKRSACREESDGDSEDVPGRPGGMREALVINKIKLQKSINNV
eukprot:12411853-Heterocapsa_arctica.AAC.1